MSALAIGLGLRRGATAQAIVALVSRALERAGEPAGEAALFTVAGKEAQAALHEAAAMLGLPLAFLPRAALASQSGAAITRSDRVVALFGVPSVAETAALAGAGAGSALIVPRMTADGVACAIARTAGEGV